MLLVDYLVRHFAEEQWLKRVHNTCRKLTLEKRFSQFLIDDLSMALDSAENTVIETTDPTIEITSTSKHLIKGNLRHRRKSRSFCGRRESFAKS